MREAGDLVQTYDELNTCFYLNIPNKERAVILSLLSCRRPICLPPLLEPRPYRV